MQINILVLLLASVAAALLSFALTPVARRLAFVVGAIDIPDARKVHTAPVPRLGGVAVILSALAILTIVFALTPASQEVPEGVMAGLLLGLLPIFAISIADDIRPMKAAPKFAAHFLGAGIAVSFGIRLASHVHLFGYEIQIGVLAIPISILWIAGLTSAFNLVDGLDGLSAGLALISATTLTGVSLFVQRDVSALAAAVLAGAIVGFLPYNLHPARIFLGDSGATALGFFLACIALRGGSTMSSGLAVLAPVIVLGIPLADTLVSMARRGVRRLEHEKGSHGLFEADRNHFHHRLLQLGLSHRNAVLVLYGCGLTLAAVAYLSLFLKHANAALLLGTIVAALAIGLKRLGYEEFAFLKKGTVLKLYDLPMLKYAVFGVFVDLSLAVGAMYLAIVLKYEDPALRTYDGFLTSIASIVLPATLLIFYVTGMYRRKWKLVSIGELIRTSFVVIGSVVVSYAGFGLAQRGLAHAAFFATYGFLFLFAIIGARASFRLFEYVKMTSRVEGEPVLVYGAGVAGSLAIREMLTNTDHNLRPVGFIDDDATMVGRIVGGFPVLGTLETLLPLLTGHGISGVIVSSEKVTRERILRLRTVCESVGASLRYFRVAFRDLSEYEFNVAEAAAEGARIRLRDEPVAPIAIGSYVAAKKARRASQVAEVEAMVLPDGDGTTQV